MRFSLKDIESDYGFGDEAVVSLQPGTYKSSDAVRCPWVTPLSDNSVPTTISQALATGAGMGLSSGESFSLFQLGDIKGVDGINSRLHSSVVLPDQQLNNVDFWLRVFSALVHELYYTMTLDELGRVHVDESHVTVITIIYEDEGESSYRAPKGFFHAAVGVARMHMFGLSR